MTEQRFSMIEFYERLPVAVYICDRNDLLVDYNTAAAALFPVAPLTGVRDWYPNLAIYDKQGRKVDAAYKPVTTGIKTHSDGYREELTFHLPDGEERFILVSSVAVWDDMANYDGAIHTLSDVTALRNSEKQLALLAAIVDSSEDAIITKDLEGRITSWNRAAERLYGYTAVEVIGRQVSLIIPAERLHEEEHINEAIRTGQIIEHYETVRLAKSGTGIPVSLTVSPVRDGRGRVIGASKIARDITRQKQLEEKLQVYTLQLEDQVAERTRELNEALSKEKELGQLKSRFVSMASHEFRTPLSSVKLSASLIEKYNQTCQDQQIGKHATKIQHAVNDLTAILGDFLSLEKLESGKVSVSHTEFDLAAFCGEIATEMQLLTRPGQQITYRHTGFDVPVYLDQLLLKNCLHNLLSNAIKYSGEDTMIDLNTEISEAGCRLTVNDHGIGIPEADQEHLFSAFFRASNTGTIQGTGLGLSIVARYAGLMGGKIEFKSYPGIGTTFVLLFPV